MHDIPAVPLAASVQSSSGESGTLDQYFDGVVMLTWSDWHREPRSNRYHYATRFARTIPVLFVQPDGAGKTFRLEDTQVAGVTILHVPAVEAASISPHEQAKQLALALASRRMQRPLLWVYNPFMDEFVRRCYAPLKVYHATEDYFESERLGNSSELRQRLTSVIEQCDLVVAVSEGVADSYRRHTRFGGPIHVAPNGCDYEFFAGIGREMGLPPAGTRIALFQGGINWRVDFDLLRELSTLLPDWQFQLCGQEGFDSRDRRCRRRWQALKARPNVRYLGYLNAEDTARAMHGAAVGLIPFVRERAIVERSLPLKAFEYVACGLPVLSIPIRQLAPSPELFTFCDSAADFAEQITRLHSSRWQEPALRLRAEHAARRSYETAFTNVCQRLRDRVASRRADLPTSAPAWQEWESPQTPPPGRWLGWKAWVRKMLRRPVRFLRRVMRPAA